MTSRADNDKRDRERAPDDRTAASSPSRQRRQPVVLPAGSRPTDRPAGRAAGLGVVGVFSGIGGIELGLQQAGHHIELLCDSDPAALRVLRRRFSATEVREDIHDLATLPEADCLCAGFPCQDLSQVGGTSGINGAKSGIISTLFRILDHTQKRPNWILIENVPFMLRLDGGRAIHFLVSNLEQLGYKWAYRTIDTRAFGLPQRRLRIFLLASLDGNPDDVLLSEDQPSLRVDESDNSARGFYWTEGNRGIGWAIDAIPPLKGGSGLGIPSPPAVWRPRDGTVVTPSIGDAERLQGFPLHWTAPASQTSDRNRRARGRGHRWRLVGNAVSVPVSRWIGSRMSRPKHHDEDAVRADFATTGWPSAAWGGSGVAYTSHVGKWPVAFSYRHLEDVLSLECQPLSYRATIGIHDRLASSSLRIDSRFFKALAKHRDSMARLEACRSSVVRKLGSAQ
jgi:DNA (cytosine-5)-methyltransferase 1